MPSDDSELFRADSGPREFDAFAATYDDLLRDPLRDWFSSRQNVFFHRRKRDLIVKRFARCALDTSAWSYLDVGCGHGELLRLLSREFASSAGCDASVKMLAEAGSGHIVFQDDALRLPFEDCSFDFATAVCLYHHVPGLDRPALTREVYRVLKPGGAFCIIEHNPANPITRLIVARSPVDADARLLSHRETCRLMRECGVDPEETAFFMYLPEPLYRRSPSLEEALKWLPLGGQYAVFGRRPLARIADRTQDDVARAVMPAASPIVPTFTDGSILPRRKHVETNLDTAGTSARATKGLRPSVKTGLLMLLAAAYLLPLIWILDRVGDQGTIIYGAQRVSQGAIPGRDFLEVIGPGAFYWLGLFFKIFGLGWSVTRLFLAFTGVATAGLLYAISRQVCRESVAVLLCLFAVVTGLPLWPAVSHHWDSNLFAIAALWCYLKLEKTKHPGWAIAAGTLAGFTSCFMQEKGLLLLLALVASSLTQRIFCRGPLSTAGVMLAGAGKQPNWRFMWLLPGSYAAVGIVLLAAYWKAGALGNLYYANVTWPMSAYRGINSIPYGAFLPSLAMTPAYRVFGPAWSYAAILCAGLSWIPLLVIAILPLLVGGSTLAALFTADGRRPSLRSPSLTLTLAGGALWLSEMHRSDFFHSVYGSPVLLIALFASPYLKVSTSLAKAFMGTLAAGLIVLGALNFMAHRSGRHDVETSRGTIPSVTDDEALRFLCTSVKRREFVFVYPYYPIYYYLADVQNPTRFSILLYGYNTPEQFDEVIRNLELKHVRYVLWDTQVYGDKLRAWFPAYRHPSDDRLKLEHYLQSRYAVIALKSGFRILLRRAADEHPASR